MKLPEGSRDILLTGVPRSGTTLCCALLNAIPDMLALAEPMRIDEFDATAGAEAACARVASFMRQARERAHRDGAADTMHVEGRFIDNPIAPAMDASASVRSRVARQGSVVLDRKMPDGFRLVVKHNALFTALLESLSQQFPVYAVIRDPLAVLASWHSVDLAVHQGNIPAGELFDPELRHQLSGTPDRLDRQFLILDWFFRRFAERVPAERIIRYEELVAGTSPAFARLCGVAVIRQKPLSDHNRSYDSTLLQRLESELHSRTGAWQSFYGGR